MAQDPNTSCVWSEGKSEHDMLHQYQTHEGRGKTPPSHILSSHFHNCSFNIINNHHKYSKIASSNTHHNAQYSNNSNGSKSDASSNKSIPSAATSYRPQYPSNKSIDSGATSYRLDGGAYQQQ
eukprot:238925_1